MQTAEIIDFPKTGDLFTRHRLRLLSAIVRDHRVKSFAVRENQSPRSPREVRRMASQG